MRRPAAAVKPRTSVMKSFPAPIAGWISNRNLATPDQNGGVQGAAILDNFLPTATSAILRRGSERYATLGGGDLSIRALFTYVVGDVDRMFAATQGAIYDITSVPAPEPWMLVDEAGDMLVTDTGDTLGYDPSVDMIALDGLTGGEWATVQFATEGGVFLVAVNGADEGVLFNGDNFYPLADGGALELPYTAETAAFTSGATVTGTTSGASGKIWRVRPSTVPGEGILVLTGVSGSFNASEAITDGSGGAATTDGTAVAVGGTDVSFPSGSGLTTANLSYVWAYKNRLYFIQRDSLDAWYLPVDSVAGELKKLPIGGDFGRGGALLFGASWSLDSGASGGLSEQIVFVSTEGEAAVYQGASPDSADTWGRVGVYFIGTPLGPKAWVRAGADLLIDTTIGKVAMSQAIQRAAAALAPAAVSFPIEVAWNDAVQGRGTGWSSIIWAEGQMMVVALPSTPDDIDAVFVANTRTGAWSRFTGWNATCMAVFRGQLYFGSTGGRILRAMVSGTDEGAAYTGRYVPLFDDAGAPASQKTALLAKATIRSGAPVAEDVQAKFDFDTDLGAPPAAAVVPPGNQWGNATWGEATWGGRANAILSQRRHSVGGYGYRMSPSLQITSGAAVPIDAEIVAVDLTYEITDVFA